MGNSLTDKSSKNKRIAKNTLLLYIRMILTMGVALYTSRVVLQALGVTDFGIFNVVGGVVAMLSFLTGSMAGTVSRYITYALGEDDENKLQRVVSTTKTIQWVFAGIVILLAETIGLWFLWYKMQIPSERVHAAFWVYQCSLMTSMVAIVSVPYNALIVAHEKMGVFAYVSIFEAFAKLSIALLISFVSIDRLILYGILLLIVQIIIRLLYTYYCKKEFPESKVRLSWNKSLLIEISAYSGWCTLGYLSVVGYTQGLNILLNLFFGPVVNAARAIAVQVQSAVVQFCANFQMALNPQITKSYASGDLSYMHQLLISSSKYSFFLMIFLSFPIILNANYILQIWLGEVPDYTADFVRITLIIGCLESLKNPLLASIHATGKIRKFQIVEGLMLIMIVPASYVLLKSGITNPIVVFICYMVVEFLTQVVRVKMILPRVGMKVYLYIKLVVLPILPIVTVVWSIALLYKVDQTLISLITSSLSGFALLLVLIYTIGLKKDEKQFLIKKISCLCRKL